MATHKYSSGQINYPEAYHKAISHLVSFGGHGGNRAKGRLLVARALRALRAQSHERARYERGHMLYISGQFPVKDKVQP
jgi:hypothetical protein